MSANLLSAVEAAKAIRDGMLTSEELVLACLARIDEVEDTVGAWAHLDPDRALEQARAADVYRSEGLPLGPLHGIPVGIKDIIDTQDFPTEHGTPIYAGRTPSKDATLVSLLREAGAVILGKTVTAELAVFSPGKTTNPHNAAYTPGGSSSGSAAAVAAGMVPLAVGSQTNGSTIRPASFCGVFGFKPTFGRISRNRVLAQSQPLDTIGVFARTLEDVALIAEVLMGFDDRDPSMRPMATPPMVQIMAEEPPVPPRFAFVRTSKWDEAGEETKDGLRELVDHLNQTAASVDMFDLPSPFEEVHKAHAQVMEADLAKSFAGEYKKNKDKLSAILIEMIERGQKVSKAEYKAALEQRDQCIGILNSIFEDYDAILTPATPGAAPEGLDATGSPVFNTIWTFAGTPALSLPVLQGANNLPIGVQLVGQNNDDARLMRTARWMMKTLET